MIDTILFDLDGTLLDTNELIIASFVHAFKVHQVEGISARDAGVRSVGVAWSLQGETSLRKFNPAFMLQDMRDLLEIVAGEATLKQTLISNEG
ncbi:MAG: haloacid dehalogenase-like family hydrolase [Bacilli bacterium]|nr:haloacid dehalogenase-like family hydrolase [Bacilli bacterium]